MCVYGNSVILTLPDWCDVERKNRQVAIDACIADDIQYIWELETETLGCCCGHNRDIPSVIISQKYTSDDCAMLSYMLYCRGREWNVIQNKG